MYDEFVTYRSFNDVSLVEDLTSRLTEAEVEYLVVDSSALFNATFDSEDVSTKEYNVKLRSRDFEKVNDLLIAQETLAAEAFEDDHYLFGFNDDELMDILLKDNEWSKFDVVLARQILKDRGHLIDEEQIKAAKQKCIEILTEPQRPHGGLVLVGYLSAVLGGMVGVFIGWHLVNYKKTLPNGQEIYVYLETDRKQGKNIFWLGIIMLIFCIGVKIIATTTR